MAQKMEKLGKSRASMPKSSTDGLGVEVGSKSINAGTRGAISRSSMPKFANSPSGGTFSERRWKSPTVARDSINNESELYRAGSMSPRDEPKSPFTVRSGQGSQIQTSSEILKMIDPNAN